MEGREGEKRPQESPRCLLQCRRIPVCTMQTGTSALLVVATALVGALLNENALQADYT